MLADGLSERFDRIENRVDALSADMNTRFGKATRRRSLSSKRRR